jgi:hypothetical protein
LPGEILTVSAEDTSGADLFLAEGSVPVTLSGRPGVVFRIMLDSPASTGDEHMQLSMLAPEKRQQKRFTRFIVQPVGLDGVTTVEIISPGPLHMSCGQIPGMGGSADAVYLIDVKDGGLAHRHGATAGDCLISVNEQPASEIPFESLMTVISTSPRPLKLTVRKSREGAGVESGASIALAYSQTSRHDRAHGQRAEEQMPLSANDMERGGGGAEMARTLTFSRAARGDVEGGGGHLIKTVSIQGAGGAQQEMQLCTTRDNARVRATLGRNKSSHTYAFDFMVVAGKSRQK